MPQTALFGDEAEHVGHFQPAEMHTRDVRPFVEEQARHVHVTDGGCRGQPSFLKQVAPIPGEEVIDWGRWLRFERRDNSEPSQVSEERRHSLR